MNQTDNEVNGNYTRRGFLKTALGATAGAGIERLVAQDKTSETDPELLEAFRQYAQSKWQNTSPKERTNPMPIWKLHYHNQIAEVKLYKVNKANTNEDILIMWVYDMIPPASLTPILGGSLLVDNKTGVIYSPSNAPSTKVEPKSKDSFVAYQDKGINGALSNSLNAKEPKKPMWIYADTDKPGRYYNLLLSNRSENKDYQAKFSDMLRIMAQQGLLKKGKL